MLNLLSVEFIAIMPIAFFAVAIFVITVIAVVVGKRHADNQKSAANYRMQMQQRQEEANSLLQNKLSDPRTPKRSISYETDSHEHIGEEERYEKIVGSLGEVDDEGCVDLDGIRLIAHDEAYEGETASRNYSEIIKAMVLGEVLDNPRFKKRHK